VSTLEDSVAQEAERIADWGETTRSSTRPAGFFALVLSGAILAACAEPAPRMDAPPLLGPTDALGGRLFDTWYSRAATKEFFRPDDKTTPGIADGFGGPFQNGTLPLRGGRPMLNDAGHDYRLKNFFGWDLRGADGIYGPKYMAKPYVAAKNLLAPGGTADELRAELTHGTEMVPAFGDAMSKEELDAIVAFVMAMREGRLPRPEQIFDLRPSSPGNYALRGGGDAKRGAAIVAERCAGCHGANGTRMTFDQGEFSLGSHARQKAYEDWLKIMNGQPATEMGRFLRGKTGAAMAAEILDILAALCDRTAFPPPAGKADVPEGDPRCGGYLR
jgi:mono/diheme cytochrome c family protein